MCVSPKVSASITFFCVIFCTFVMEWLERLPMNPRARVQSLARGVGTYPTQPFSLSFGLIYQWVHEETWGRETGNPDIHTRPVSSGNGPYLPQAQKNTRRKWVPQPHAAIEATVSKGAQSGNERRSHTQLLSFLQ